MDDIDIDDYSRDRSRSPVRDRSPSGRRDYEAPRGEERYDRRERRGSGRGDRREEVFFDRRDDRRDDRRGDRRDDRRGGRRDRDERRGGYARRDRDRGDRGDRRDRGGFRERDERRDRDRDVDRNYDNSIFVGNIPFRTTTRDVEDLFGRDFRIRRAEVITQRGKSRGMAYVEFESKQDVQDAIAKFDRTDYFGRDMFVRQDYPPPEERRRDERRDERRDDRRDRREDRRDDRRDEPPRERRDRFNPAEPPKPGTEVFVGNLPFATTWKTLKDMMRTSGGVARADVIENRWGRSRGFGTVVFDTPEDAQAAIERFNGEVLEGRQLEVRLSKDISERRRPESRNTEFTEGVTGDGPPSSVIYADNLPFITTEADLHELFETIGRVTRAEIQYNDRGRPNGTAVVEFESSSLADVAITNLNGYNYGGRDLRISYARRPENYDAPMDAEPEQYSAEPEQYQGEPQQFSAEPEQFTAEPVQQYQGEPAVTGDAIDEDIQDAPQQA